MYKDIHDVIKLKNYCLKLDQKLIEISYKKGGPLKSVTPLHALGCH